MKESKVLTEVMNIRSETTFTKNDMINISDAIADQMQKLNKIQDTLNMYFGVDEYTDSAEETLGKIQDILDA